MRGNGPGTRQMEAMRLSRFLNSTLTTALVFFAGVNSLSAATAEESSIPGIIRQMLARTRETQTEKGREHYVFLKTSVTEELGAKGEVKSRKQKEYEVRAIGGAAYSRLIRIDGRELKSDERAREEEKERKFRQRLESGRKPAPGRRQQETVVSEEIINRYQFVLDRHEVLNGRKTFVISFKPRGPNYSVKNLADRFLNRISGTVWVDEEEFEIARLDLRLVEKTSLWGGLLASLESFELSLNRRRIDRLVWFDDSSEVTFQGRKLFDTIRMHAREETKDFKRTDAGLLKY